MHVRWQTLGHALRLPEVSHSQVSAAQVFTRSPTSPGFPGFPHFKLAL